MSAPFTSYKPSGPTVARFHMSDAFDRDIMGPVGSGKTGGCLMEIIYRGRRQAPHPVTKLRRTKFAVIRDTYRQLEKTTLQSWLRWVPKSIGDFIGGSAGSPATHRLQFDMRDGTIADILVEFIGLGDNTIDRVMPGWEGTGAYLNEKDKLSPDVPTYLRGRLGRYPEVDEANDFAGASWRGMWGDFNAPDTDHWLYDKKIKNPITIAELKELGIELPNGQEPSRFFWQPPAMLELQKGGPYRVNPKAENLQNLPAGYYEQQIIDQPRWYILRMVLNRFGASREGQPVYEEYDDEFHCAPIDIEPVEGVPLIIGGDAGLQGALLITQHLPDGTWLWLDEICAPKTGMGAKKMGERLNQLLAERYAPWSNALDKVIQRSGLQTKERDLPIRGVGDPSAVKRAEDDDDRTWFKTISAVTKIPFKPAPTNAITPRLESVRLPLTRKDGHPGFQISPRCKEARHGFNSGYRVKRIQKGSTESFDDTPEKNYWSAVHDAGQYAHLGGGEYMHVLGRDEQQRERRSRHRVAEGTPEDRFGE